MFILYLACSYFLYFSLHYLSAKHVTIIYCKKGVIQYNIIGLYNVLSNTFLHYSVTNHSRADWRF